MHSLVKNHKNPISRMAGAPVGGSPIIERGGTQAAHGASGAEILGPLRHLGPGGQWPAKTSKIEEFDTEVSE